MTELALIAFDGLDPRVIEDNREELPNLDAFMSDSIHGRWQTPGHTIPSYTATLTGKQYNNCNFHWDEGGGDYQKHRQTEFSFMWDDVEFNMTLLNMPTLYPPEDIDDAMVCGFLTPDSLTTENLARPMEVQQMLNEMNYTPDVPADETYAELGGEEMKNKLQGMMHQKVNVARDLIKKYNSELFYGVWTETDRWFHQCQKHNEDHWPLYQTADDVAGKMIEMLPNDIPIIMFSDHGFAHFEHDDGVHKGHMYEGWYSINAPGVDGYRDDSANLFDLYPTVLNYFGEDIPQFTKGRVLLHHEEQDDEVRQRLEDLGYLE